MKNRKIPLSRCLTLVVFFVDWLFSCYIIPNGLAVTILVVLQLLMGGGGSFSAGGPGKGMHSRLCKFGVICSVIICSV